MTTVEAVSVHDRLMAIADRLAAAGEQAAPPCPDAVNLPMIRHWTQAVGEDDPRYLDPETPGGPYAPPAMIQVWSMPGLTDDKGGGAADEAMRLLDASGFTGVVATNCEQTYDRYVRHGERLRSTMRFGGITGPKRTGLGEGYFVTWHQTWYDENGARVAEMLFRVLKFRPPASDPAPASGPASAPASDSRPGPGPGPGRYPLRPAIGLDTRFFWDGVDQGELRIQRCAGCGALRHPPGPMCPRCHATERDHVVASGRGEVHSYVVHHHPPVPGRTPPYVVAVVDLEEGVRIVGNVIGCPPEDVRVGMPVRLVFERMDDELTLPQWTPVTPAPEPLVLPLTPTFVIATALATRDFMPVHHDPGLARAQGSKDIFLNILTTMGLVQRFAGRLRPGAVLRGISVRLGVPAYAGDTLTLTGRAVDERTLEIRGAVSLGDHVIATVRLEGDR